MIKQIYILGTRGIPNKYGGFEEFAEQLYFISQSDPSSNIIVTGLEKSNLSNTKYFKSFTFFGEFIRQIIYDTIASIWVILQPRGYVYHCGYGTAFIGIIILKITNKIHGHKVILNIDGIEWKRSKFNFLIQKLVKLVESFCVFMVDEIVADNGGINKYISERYNLKSHIIAYGSEIVSTISKNKIKLTHQILNSTKNKYDLVISRIEPENNIEEIILAYNKSSRNLLIVGNFSTKFGLRMKSISSSNIVWLGAIYEKLNIEYLRQNCQFYVHGHSVGGTNPSLLQAMSSRCKLLIHNNDFNREVASGLFWTNHIDLFKILSNNIEICFDKKIELNTKKIKTVYSWKNIYNKTIMLT